MSSQFLSAEQHIGLSKDCSIRSYKDLSPSYYPHQHDFYEISLLVAGTLRITISDRATDFYPGSLILIPPYLVHSRANVSNNGPFHMLNVNFRKTLYDDIFHYIGISDKNFDFFSNMDIPCVYLPPSQIKSIQIQFESLNTLPAYDGLRMKMASRFMLIDILVNKFLMNAVEKPVKPDAPSWFNRLIASLSEKDALCAGVDYIYKTSGKSKEHICRTFQKYLNQTPTQYINVLRLNYALNLLSNTDKPIIDIALDCGFSSISYFYSQFQNTYHMSPKQLRHMVRKSQEPESPEN